MNLRRGFTRVPNSVLHGEHRRADGRRISHAASVLYGLILDYSRYGQHDCAASQETLAAELGVSDRHVRNLLGELHEAQLISSRRQGFRDTNAVTPLWLPERNPASADARNSASDKEEPPPKNDTGVGTKEERRSNNERSNARA